MKSFIRLFAVATLFAALASPVVLFITGCTTPPVTLAPGGAYADANRFVVARTITDADSLLLSLIAWYDANKTYLAKWPEVGHAAELARLNEPKWALDAENAGDAYIAAVDAYKAGSAASSSTDAAQQKFSGAIAVIKELTKQLQAYQATHPHA